MYANAGEFAGGAVAGYMNRRKRARSEGVERNGRSIGVNYFHQTGRYAEQKLRRRRPFYDLLKEHRLLTKKIVYHTQGVSGYDVNNGFQFLSSQMKPAAGYYYAPLVLFDLTTVPNVDVGADASVRSALAGYRLYFNNNTSVTTKRASFDTVTAQAISNSALAQSCQWDLKADPESTAIDPCYPGASDILDWVKIKLMLYGASTKTTHFKIQLVQFKNDYLCPEWNPVTGMVEYAGLGASDVDIGQTRAAFYSALIQPYCYSPILTEGYHLVKRNMKVLKNWDVRIEPKLSTESDTVPANVDWSYYWKCSRKQRYDWALSTAPAGMTASDVMQTVGRNRVTVHPRARVYLMIRCTSATNTTYAAGDAPAVNNDFVRTGVAGADVSFAGSATTDASFDYYIDKGHLMN